ncbi:MAG: efflux RND transporter permease subunit [Chromatiales bacterium]|nr:efflux RND transporter permease subunit [Chromatiales bacterium]
MAEKEPNPPTPTDESVDLGLAGKTAKAFIHSPLSPLLFLAMLAMGIIGLLATPRQEDPQISVPLIDIFLQYPGASATEVASLAIEPLERVMSEIPGVKHVYSYSERERGIVTVRFKVGEETGPSLVKVHDKIASNIDAMPPGVQQPLVKPNGIDDVPVVTLTLWSHQLDGSSLRRLGVNLLQNFKQIPNTGRGFVVGGQPDEVRVEIRPELLSGFGLGLDQVANTIRTANNEQGTGATETSNKYFRVYTGGFLKSARDVERLVVGTYQGRPVYVSDVAKVVRGPSEARQHVSYFTGPSYADEFGRERSADGDQAVTVAISKKKGSNGVEVANAILERVDSMMGRVIPASVNVEVTRNYGVTANEKVNNLIFKLFIATGAVTVLVLYFLGLKPAIVVTVVIPVVILMTVFAAFVMGFTVDRVSLFALIFSIGILVDDAIVVVENIYRRWLMAGNNSTEVAVDAVREVGNPTILATFTVVAALLPMAFVSGLMGPYMAPIPILGSVAMIISLFAAFAFTPWWAMRIRPTMEKLKKMEHDEHKSEEFYDRLFRRVLGTLIENKLAGRLFLVGLIGAFFFSCFMFYATWVPVKMLPYDNKGEFTVVVDLPEGTALAETVNLNRKLSEALRSIPEVAAMQTYAGTARPFDFNGMVRHYYLRSEPWQGEVHVQLIHKNKRKKASHDIALEARELLLPIAKQVGARLTMAEMPPGPPVMQSVVAEIYGPDAKTRREVAAMMTGVFENTEGLADVDNYMQASHDVWRFEVDTEKAVRRGISVDAIIRNLNMSMGGYQLGDVKGRTGLEPTFIVIEVPLSVRSDINRLGNLPIVNAQGESVPLTELGRFVKFPQDEVIHHKDLRPLEYVVGDAVGRLGAPIYPMLKVEEALQAPSMKTPDGVMLTGTMTGPPPDNGESGFEWGGEWTVTYETFRDMGVAFGVALILIYMLVVGLFGNFIVPLVIMAPIPLTLLGIVPGHLLWAALFGGAEFTATSMIGFIALAGIIVRNSILLVDFAIEEVRKGVAVREAVLRSCKARTRPIQITALALVGGAGVILTDPIFQGMAVALVFGVLVSTVLTLVVIPLGCISAHRSVEQVARERGMQEAPGAAAADH